MFRRKSNISSRNGIRFFTKIRPAFETCTDCIVFCADDGYMALTSVAIQSITDHASEDKFYDILVLHGGVNKEHEETYHNHWKGHDNVRIRFVNVAPLFDGLNLYTKNRENFTREAYFRLIIPWVVSDEYKKALYLDGDMLLRSDLAPIFDIELGDDKLLGAVKDYWGICNCYMPNDPRRKYRKSIGLDDIDHYVISATLLFNLAVWRKQFSVEQVIRLCTSKRWQQHDQDVVNILCNGSAVFLSPAWGMMEDYGNNHFLPQYMLRELAEVADDPIIVHYGGVRKPYQRAYVKFDDEFWKCADQTPYMTDLFERVQSEEYRNYVAYSLDPNGIEQVPGVDGTETAYKGVSLGKARLGHQKYKMIRIHDKVLHLEAAVGFFGLRTEDDVAICISVNGHSLEAVSMHGETIQNKKLRTVYSGYVTIFDVPLSGSENSYKIRLDARINGKSAPLSKIVFQQYAELSGRFKNDYYSHEGMTIRHDADDTGIIVTADKGRAFLRNEGRLLWEVFWAKRVLGGKKAVVLRTIANICKPFVRKPIWLVSDRMGRADDNGEVFFRYLKENHSKEIHAYFLLLPDSKDYGRLKKVGDIVTPYSWKHKLLALLAEWSISSQTDYIYRDPFRDYGHPYRDMLRKTRFVFLQHGVISNDLSRWLDKDIQELDGFVTSTHKEYASILSGAYHYTEDKVWLTGLPRFDRLADHKQKIVTIMPTWRMYLFTGQDRKTGEWALKKEFGNSDYAVFYRSLMNNDRLKQEAARLGYVIQFKAHPTCTPYLEEFLFDKDVVIVPEQVSYSELYSRSGLVVTDYSSAVYDFAYLRKPVIYCQFDADTFFSGKHIYDKGYFDYEKDGFGEVLYNLEDTIEAIISYMKTGCTLRDVYRDRIDSAFPNSTESHCEQLYKRIISAGKY